MSATRSFFCGVLAMIVASAACDVGAERPAEAGDAATGAWLDAPTQLAPIDHSGVTGSVVPESRGDELTILVALEGLTTGAEYSVYLHDGRCAAGGAVRLPLGRIQARDDGTATVRMRSAASDLPAGETVSVQVRTAGGIPVACANLLPDR